MQQVRILIALGALGAWACGGGGDDDGDDTTPGIDAGQVDSGSGIDAGVADATPADAATPTLDVSPASSSVDLGGTRQLSAIGTGATGGVTWSVMGGGAGGSVDANGLYTAPGDRGGSDTVVATSVEFPALAASATVSIVLPPPTLSGSTPGSPSSDAAPVIAGQGVAGFNVDLFASAACSGAAIGSGTVGAGGDFAIAAAVTPNATTAVAGRLRDGFGNVSACSTTSVTYVHDAVAPSPPALVSTAPQSPGSDATPDVTGTAEAGASVLIYTDSSCLGAGVGAGTADGAGNFTITAAAAANTTTTFSASATDAAGNVSGCSAGLAYLHDDVAPSPPVLTGTLPLAPANDNAPLVVGTAEAGAGIDLFAGAGCSGAPVASGSSVAGAFQIAVSVPDDSVRSFSALATDAAGNVSGCSNFVTFQEDSTPPAPPSVTGTNPGTGSNDNLPAVLGTAEPLSTITVHGDAACAGPALGSDSAGAGGNFSVDAAVADDSSNTLHATATDAAGNTSGCSTSFAAYDEDSTAPAPPVLSGTTPASPSASDTTPTVAGTAEAGATIDFFAGSCGGASIGSTTADGAGDFSTDVTVPANATTQIRATATDAAGNESGCATALSYTHDSLPPAVTVAGTAPGSPANQNAPVVTGSTEPGATVDIFAGAGCPGAAIGNGSADAGGAFAVTVSVGDDSTTELHAKATDALGNQSGCSPTSTTYVEDSTPPAPPTVEATSPASPVNDNTLAVTGDVGESVTVTVYADPLCAGTAAGSAAGTAAAGFSVAITVADNTQTTFYATATDAAGNVSACSPSFVTYVEQTPSAVPSVAGVISFAGTPPAGRVYVVLENSTCSDCITLGGTSIPGPGPFLIRGVEGNGQVRVRAWIDTLGVQARNLAADPSGEVLRTLDGSSNIANADIALVTPTPSPLPAPSSVTVLTSGDIALVLWERIQLGRLDRAELYEVTIAGPDNRTIVVPGSLQDFALVSGLAPGSYTVSVRGRAGGVFGPAVSTNATLGAPSAGFEVTGVADFGGTVATGPLYVALVPAETGGPPVDFHAVRIDGATSPQAFSVPGVPAGDYQVIAIMDQDDSGHIDLTEPHTIPRGDVVLVNVVNVTGDTDAGTVTIPAGNARVRAATDHFSDFFGFEGVMLELRADVGRKLPVQLVYEGGPGLTAPIDLGLRSQSSAGELGSQFTPGLQPQAGDEHSLRVIYDDGTSEVLPATVTAVLALPTAVSPELTTLGQADPHRPTFTWQAPSPAPSGTFSFGFGLFESGAGDVWFTQLPSSATTVEFNVDGGANQDPLSGLTTYSWQIEVRDQDGNRSRDGAEFTTPP